MEEYNYDALCSTIKFEDITSSKSNQNILRRLKENDIDKLWICDEETTDGDTRDYIPLDNENDMGWLGYFIGNNTSLKEFRFLTLAINYPKALCRGMNNNQSIMKIGFYHANEIYFGIFRMLDPFFKSNHNLIEILMSDCSLMDKDVRLLSLALGSFKSLKKIRLEDNEMGDGQLVDIIFTLSAQPQLEKLDLLGMNVGRNECTALASLLWNTTKHLHTLNLGRNNIDDEGVETLVHALSGCNQLQELSFSCNRSITARGWETVSTLLERPDSNLKELFLCSNSLGNEGALMFANALRINTKLKHLNLPGNGISREGWTSFSKLLCDTSSVNNMYLSNHTLGNLGMRDVSADVRSYLDLNRSSENKRKIAMTKILCHNSHINMQPFFEWELKVLPLIVTWLEKATACTTEFDEQIRKMKLSCIYDFVREFPMLYIEPVTRKEIEEFSVLEIRLQRKSQQAELKDVQKCKTRAMRRLF